MECFGVFFAFMTLHLSFISLLTHWNAFDKSRNIASGTQIKVTSVFIGYSPEYKSPPATQQVVDCIARKMLPIVHGLCSTLVYIQYAEGACVCIGLHSCVDMVLKSKSKPFFSKIKKMFQHKASSLLEINAPLKRYGYIQWHWCVKTNPPLTK